MDPPPQKWKCIKEGIYELEVEEGTLSVSYMDPDIESHLLTDFQHLTEKILQPEINKDNLVGIPIDHPSMICIDQPGGQIEFYIIGFFPKRRRFGKPKIEEVTYFLPPIYKIDIRGKPDKILKYKDHILNTEGLPENIKPKLEHLLKEIQPSIQ